jgi:hypothetical protein
MHRLTTSWLGLGVLAAVSCGAPAELDANLYPGPTDTGYADSDSTGSAGTPLGGSGAGGQGSSAVAGSANAGNNGGSATPPAAGGPGGGNAAAPTGGNTAAPSGGGDTPPAAGSAGGCPDDITVLFNRPLNEGGCASLGCHVAEQGTPPDLVSPNPETRLIDVTSNCNGRPYIGTGDSFLADKISGERPECGQPMPLLATDLLSDADRQCMLDWIDEVSGG